MPPAFLLCRVIILYGYYNTVGGGNLNAKYLSLTSHRAVELEYISSVTLPEQASNIELLFTLYTKTVFYPSLP
jgi:hypothetical protein